MPCPRLPRADGRVPRATSVRARYHRAPHAFETAFRCRVRPTPVPKALPSAYSGSGHAVLPLPPTSRDVNREAKSSMSLGQSSSFSRIPGVTTRKPSNTSSPISIFLVLPVKFRAAFPATASSTKLVVGLVPDDLVAMIVTRHLGLSFDDPALSGLPASFRDLSDRWNDVPSEDLTDWW